MSTFNNNNKVAPILPKPQRQHGRETSWGMMDILADMEEKESIRSQGSNNGMATRTTKLATRAAAIMPNRRSLKACGRESSWGFVDVLQMLEDEAANEGKANIPPAAMPSNKGRNFAASPKRARAAMSKSPQRMRP